MAVLRAFPWLHYCSLSDSTCHSKLYTSWEGIEKRTGGNVSIGERDHSAGMISVRQDAKLLDSTTDKNSFLDKTVVRLLNLPLGLSMHFPVESTICNNPAKASLPRNPHPQYLITLDIWLGSPSSTVLPVMSDHPGLSSARILLGQFSQKSPLTLVFPLSNFPSNDSHPAS